MRIMKPKKIMWIIYICPFHFFCISLVLVSCLPASLVPLRPLTTLNRSESESTENISPMSNEKKKNICILINQTEVVSGIRELVKERIISIKPVKIVNRKSLFIWENIGCFKLSGWKLGIIVIITVYAAIKRPITVP